MATSQNVISLGQALLLWKRARRDRALAAKVSQLANVPCTTAPTASNGFTLDNGNNGALACRPGLTREMPWSRLGARQQRVLPWAAI